ncbi:MgtC/SapB family protein [Calidifontibacter sp. DB0510]|uniref:MgtC/SapB family protein n=1 Tax=Metallococcus carri TaxID=1656884 RepID=A0A967AZ81_9MICO|nr:MgtC/SapB family protein [Metallococcus carri]NHN55821.1 MgtC/SapB family protein [Metallococcus carri]NOP38491.1 MgtC/SapB family protein [Calidifontibacter sp. DB2511S]
MSGSLDTFSTPGVAGQIGYFAARAALALVLGACIGAERQWRQRGAGLRTNALVALGAALFELFAVLLAGEQGADPTRIAAYIVSGVGFLGGGVILRQGMNVTGINTAATIWCSAAVGTLSGAGYPLEATIGAALIMIVHLALRPVARHIDRLPITDDIETVYRFRAVCRAEHEAHIRALVVQALTHGEFHLRAVHSNDLDLGSDLVAVEAEISRQGRDDIALEAAVSRLSLEPSVNSVNWTVVHDEALPLASTTQGTDES